MFMAPAGLLFVFSVYPNMGYYIWDSALAFSRVIEIRSRIGNIYNTIPL